MTIFRQMICQTSSSEHHVYFTLADYNYDVLRLASLPNLLLCWANTIKHNSELAADDDLEITPELLKEFVADLRQRNIQIDFISGAWSERFVHVLDQRFPSTYTLILASETIYSPFTLNPFTKLLMHLLSRIGNEDSKALIAAKKVYFGVGGGMDEFLTILTSMGGAAREIAVPGREEHGVARVILEVAKS